MWQRPKFFSPGVNNYVPACAYVAAGIHHQPTVVSLGKPAAASLTAVASNIAGQQVAGTKTAVSPAWVSDSPFGRTITVDPDADPGAAGAVIVRGQDYLGQPMAESFVVGGGAGAVVQGVKAFYRIHEIESGVSFTNAVTFDVGTSALALGFPFKGQIAWCREGATYINRVDSTANITEPVLTDPQTLITGDPRGLYVPTSAPDGVIEYIVALFGDPSVNAAGNGGLFGIKHVNS